MEAVGRDLQSGGLASGALILDVGTGAGYPALDLQARYPSLRVEALEAWEPAVARARDRGVAAFHGDLLTWSGGLYDAVVANVCLNVIDDRAAAARALARLLRPGGRLYATVTLRGTLRALDRAVERICSARNVLERMQAHRFTVVTLRAAFAGGAFADVAVDVGRFTLNYESGEAMATSAPIRMGYAHRYREIVGDSGWRRLIEVLDRERGIALDVPFALLTATRSP